MAPTKVNDFLKGEDEEYIANKASKMLYFWPRKLKKNSRRDYKKKITLAYRILKHDPSQSLSMDGLEDRLNEAFKQLGSQKPKYLKDIFNKLMAFEKFKKTEPKDDFPMESEEEEANVCKKDQKWKELKSTMLRKLYKEFTNSYVDEDEEMEPPSTYDNKSTEP